jgi:hypothetical protein
MLIPVIPILYLKENLIFLISEALFNFKSDNEII